MLLRFDRGRLRDSLGATPIEVTVEGYRVYHGVAAFGDVVLEYPEHGRNELVPAAEALADDIVSTLVARPFTIHHPDDLLAADDPNAIQENAVGTVRRAWADLEASPPELHVEVMVWSRPAQEQVESGMVADLSPGYVCDEDQAPAGAQLGGKPYSVIQRRRRYNHLSGVLSARGVTPDGRRARLDEATTSPESDTYARLSMDEILGLSTPNPDATSDAEATRTDALGLEPGGDPDPNPEGGPEVSDDAAPVDAVPTIDIEAAEVVPAEALAAFSPDDAAILKTLSPEGLALLAAMAVQMKAEAAEQAIVAGEAPEVEEVDAAKVTPPADAPADEAKDATAPMAPQGLTADAVKQMIADALDACGMAGKKKDADPSIDAARKMGENIAAAQRRADEAKHAAKIDQAAVAAKIKKAREDDAAFVQVAHKDGHVKRADARVKDAATAMYAVITGNLPDLAPMAKSAIESGRRDDFVAIYQAAERKRRDALLDVQESIFAGFTHARDDGPNEAATVTLSGLTVPAKSVGRAASSAG